MRDSVTTLNQSIAIVGKEENMAALWWTLVRPGIVLLLLQVRKMWIPELHSNISLAPLADDGPIPTFNDKDKYRQLLSWGEVESFPQPITVSVKHCKHKSRPPHAETYCGWKDIVVGIKILLKLVQDKTKW